MKQTTNYSFLHQSGFTLLELLAVISILGVIFGFIALNLNALRGPRNVKIAINQLSTELRRIQSYSLASRNAPGDVPVKFYIASFPTLTTTNYVLKAIDQNYTTIPNIETINLPQGVTVSAIKVEQPGGTPVNPDPTCVDIGFSLPFGKIFIDTNRDSDGVCNLAQYAQNPSALTARSNGIVRITFRDPASNTTKTVAVYAAAGKIQEE